MKMDTMADWERWVELAREDPEEFERERAAAIENLIMSQPVRSRHRYRQLQWKIDAIRQTSPNSLYSCIRIYDMLMDSVYGPNGLVEAISLLKSRERATGRPKVSLRKKVFFLGDKRKKKMD